MTSIDIDPALIEGARRRLHSLDLAPHLLVGDGLAGVPEAAPFEGIIAIYAVPGVPLAWITQLAVANPTAQFGYHDHDRNWTRWPLPLL